MEDPDRTAGSVDPLELAGPPRLRRISEAAATWTALAGVGAACAGLQLGTSILFRHPWARPLPWIVLLAGAACLWVALQLTRPRSWAPAAALALLIPLLLVSATWCVWLRAGGILSLFVLLTPLLTAAAAILVALATRDILAVVRARRAFLADLALGSDGEDLDLQGLTPRTRKIIIGAVATIALLIGAWRYGPAGLSWATIRARGLLAGHGPLSDGFVATPSDYPYSDSPLRWYLDTESRYTRVPRAQVLEVADRVARHVGWRLAAATGSADPIEGERRLWAAGRQRELPLWIAAELRELHIFYHEESLFSRSFDPDAHFLAEEIHMDCDQLVWLFLHVAHRLDLAMSAVPSVMHVYLRYAGPAGQAPLYVETTQFRNVITAEDRVDLRGPAIGEAFFINEGFYERGQGGTWAAPALVAAARLYQPLRERDIRDCILGNVLVGVARAGLTVDVLAEAERQLAGSRDITLVANLYGGYIRRTRERAAAGDIAGARADALRARQLRAGFGVLVVSADPVEERLLAALAEMERAPE